jgi:hypothetical protein
VRRCENYEKRGFATKKNERSFEAMVLGYRRKVNELQTPPAQNLSAEEIELLQEDKRLRNRSANFSRLGEEDRAAELEPEILKIQDRVIAVKERLKKSPDAKHEILNTIAATPDSKLHQEALKIQAAGLAEYEKVLKEIEYSEKELTELHTAIIKNARLRGNWERQKFNLYLKLREIEKALPAEAHQTGNPPKAPNWDHFLVSEDAAGRAYGQRPYLIQGRY